LRPRGLLAIEVLSLPIDEVKQSLSKAANGYDEKPCDGCIFNGHVHGTPDGAAVSLRCVLGKFCNPKPIACRTQALQHLALLVARLGG
jgi:hypothetical protein